MPKKKVPFRPRKPNRIGLYGTIGENLVYRLKRAAANRKAAKAKAKKKK